MSNFTEMDCYLFGQATHYDIYRKMGAHKMTFEEEEGVCFDVWAPHADRGGGGGGGGGRRGRGAAGGPGIRDWGI